MNSASHFNGRQPPEQGKQELNACCSQHYGTPAFVPPPARLVWKSSTLFYGGNICRNPLLIPVNFQALMLLLTGPEGLLAEV